MTKKKKKRDKKDFPDLNEKTTLKLRRDYIDNRYYVDGVKNDSGEVVIKKLSYEEKKFLNKFNREYYSASFHSDYGKEGDSNSYLHEPTIDLEDVAEIKDSIRDLKAKRLKIFRKKAENTTENDRDKANYYTSLIEDMEDFLNENFPKRDVEHKNNSRNRCFLNRNKASNDFSLVSWEALKEDHIKVDKDITLKKVEVVDNLEPGNDDDDDEY